MPLCVHFPVLIKCFPCRGSSQVFKEAIKKGALLLGTLTMSFKNNGYLGEHHKLHIGCGTRCSWLGLCAVYTPVHHVSHGR